MRVEQARGQETERRILRELITNNQFAQAAASHWQDNRFRSKWSNMIGAWCVKHTLKYHCAPGKKIEAIFETWKDKTEDQDTVKTLNRFLSSLSWEHENSEPGELEYLLDLTEQHWNEIQLERLGEVLSNGVTVNNALLEVTKFKPINLKHPKPLHLFQDNKVLQQSLEHKQKVLIRYPGPAGAFLGEELAEDSFVAVIAQSKGAKSYLLLDMAWRAMRQGRKVAYFQVGDLSLNQITRRFIRRANKRPLNPGQFRIPIGITLPTGDGLPSVEFDLRSFEEPLTTQKALEAWKRAPGRNGGDFRLHYSPVQTINMTEIKSILERWEENDGYRANCTIIDYAENLAPVNPKESPLLQIEQTWSLMRQLSELRKCLVVTATQSNVQGFKSWVLTRNNFSQSKMKLAHVTAFLGINMTDEEKTHNLMRLNFVVRREDNFSETDCLWCATCLPIANPVVVSNWKGIDKIHS